jgi:hypothetical protein
MIRTVHLSVVFPEALQVTRVVLCVIPTALNVIPAIQFVIPDRVRPIGRG